MKFSQELLMAYADGELDADTRRAIETEMALDPQVAQEIERQRALRAEVSAAFVGVLDEQVPDRLLRAAGKAKASAPRRHWAWPEWTSIAASLIVGILAGRALLPGADRDNDAIIASAGDGRIVAGGPLALALSQQLSSEEGASIDIGLTFRDKAGKYCRTFGTGADPAVAGFACRDAEAWRIDMFSAAAPAAATGRGYRMASTQLPAPVVQAIAERMQGEALDADEEALARQRRWQD